MKKSGIYRITIDRSSEGKPPKSYIGQSVNIERRWKGHKHNAFYKNGKKYNLPLYTGIRYYGLENVTFEILELAPKEELNHLEIYYIKEMNTFHDGYNCDSGGDAPAEISDEIRNLLSEQKMGEKNPQWGKRGDLNANYGKKFSEERCKEISEQTRGENNPNWGKPRSEITRKRISIANTGERHWAWGKKLPKETRNKMRKALLGNKNAIKHPVKGFDKKTKEFIKEFESAAEAFRWLIDQGITKNESAYSDISKCCKGKIKSAYGYIWRYAQE